MCVCVCVCVYVCMCVCVLFVCLCFAFSFLYCVILQDVGTIFNHCNVLPTDIGLFFLKYE